MRFDGIDGVPDFECDAFFPRRTKYCMLIPVINEGERIRRELTRAQQAGVHEVCDILICDGGSTDGSVAPEILIPLHVRAYLTKLGPGKQGAQLRMGLWWALREGYEGFITIDGNDKDSIEDVPRFAEALDAGYDFVQGSRFIKGGRAINTPKMRWLAVRLIHAPVISLTAGFRFTDTTNAFRAHSKKYITHPQVQPL